MNTEYLKKMRCAIFANLAHPTDYMDMVIEQILKDQREACVEAAKAQIDKTMRKREYAGKHFPDLPEIVVAVSTAEIEF